MTDSLGSKKLYRIPEQGIIKGICAGLAQYFDIPVKLLRVLVVLSLFFGLFFFTIVAYVILVFVLDPAPAGSLRHHQPPQRLRQQPRQLLDELTGELQGSEQRLRQVERYVTSESFEVKNRFRQL